MFELAIRQNYQASYEPWDNFWYQENPRGGRTIAGPQIDTETALGISAFFAGVRIISECLAVPPLKLYERIDDDRKEVARSRGLYEVLHDRPNAWQTSYEFRVQMQAQVILRGNAYAEIKPGRRGAVDQLNPLHPGRMIVKKLSSGRLGYYYRDENNKERFYTQDDIFHVRGLMLSPDSYTGISVITYARETLGLSYALEQYGARLFSNGAMHRGVLYHPGKLSEPAHKNLQESVDKQHSGAGAHGTLILEEGMKWEKTDMSADDAQFLLSKAHQVTEVCRWINMPPHLLRDLSKSSYSNHEQETQEFLDITMMPNFKNWEQSMNRDLVVSHNHFAEFQLDSFVRANLQARYTAYGQAIKDGWMNRNEPRVKENMNPAKGLDRFLAPQNMAEVDKNGDMQPINQPAPRPAPRDLPPAAPEPPADTGASARLEHMIGAAAERINRMEVSALETAIRRAKGDGEKLRAECDRIYDSMLKLIGEALAVDEKAADELATMRNRAIYSALESGSLDARLAELKNCVGCAEIVEFANSENSRSKVQ